MMNNNILLIILSVSFILHGMEHNLSQTDKGAIINTINNSRILDCYCMRNTTKEVESAMFKSLNKQNKEKYLCWASNKLQRITQWDSQFLNETIYKNFFWKSLGQYRNDTIRCSTPEADQEDFSLYQRTNISITEPCLDIKRVCLASMSLVALGLAIYYQSIR